MTAAHHPERDHRTGFEGMTAAVQRQAESPHARTDPERGTSRAEPEESGEPACMLSEVCPACGRVISDVHAPGCAECRP